MVLQRMQLSLTTKVNSALLERATLAKNVVPYTQQSEPVLLLQRVKTRLAVCDIARSRMDFRFRWKSGYAADITIGRPRQRLRGCEITPTPPDAASPIRYPAIRPWLAGTECNSIN